MLEKQTASNSNWNSIKFCPENNPTEILLNYARESLPFSSWNFLHINARKKKSAWNMKIPSVFICILRVQLRLVYGWIPSINLNYVFNFVYYYIPLCKSSTGIEITAIKHASVPSVSKLESGCICGYLSNRNYFKRNNYYYGYRVFFF